MTMGKLTVPITDFKYSSETGQFSCYGNVKNIIDHAGDVTVDGAFVNSIQAHKLANTMPKMFWMHNPMELPLGAWVEMKEDEKGLFLEGKLSATSMGRDIQILAKDGAVDSFSIGYSIIREQWSDKGYNELLELNIVEISWVNFACNEESRLETIKTKMDEGEIPTRRELEGILRESGLSKRKAEKIARKYDPSENILEQMARLT
jgi:HK97 family phage prohead protease